MAQQDEVTSAPLLTQVQESLYSYWDSAKAAAQDLYKKTYLTTMDEKIRYQQLPPPVGTPDSETPAFSLLIPGARDPRLLPAQSLCPFSPGTCTAQAQQL